MAMRLGSGSGRWNASLEVMANSCPGIGGIFGPAAGGDQDLVRGDGLVADLDGVAVHQPAAAHMDLHAAAFEQADVDAVQPVDLLADIVAQGRPGMRRRRQRPAVGRGVLELVRVLGAVDQELLRHAAADHAGAADPVVLADADPRAVARGDTRGADAARPGADDEQIVVVAMTMRTKPQHGHNSGPPPTISALRPAVKGTGACSSRA